ncbi:hypothetical protein D3C80_1314630 [compost metagenome]
MHFLDHHPGDPDEEQCQRGNHQAAQQRHREPARATAGDHWLQARRQGDHQLIDQQAGEQRRQELERQHHQEAENGDGPAGQEQLTLTEGLHRSRER